MIERHVTVLVGYLIRRILYVKAIYYIKLSTSVYKCDVSTGRTVNISRSSTRKHSTFQHTEL